METLIVSIVVEFTEVFMSGVAILHESRRVAKMMVIVKRMIRSEADDG
jgi:hypothetical protein